MPDRKTYRPVDLDTLSQLIGERVGVEVSQTEDSGGDLAGAVWHYFAGVFQGISANYEYPDDRAANPPLVSYEIDLHNHESPIRVEWDETFVISHYA